MYVLLSDLFDTKGVLQVSVAQMTVMSSADAALLVGAVTTTARGITDFSSGHFTTAVTPRLYGWHQVAETVGSTPVQTGPHKDPH